MQDFSRFTWKKNLTDQLNPKYFFTHKKKQKTKKQNLQFCSYFHVFYPILCAYFEIMWTKCRNIPQRKNNNISFQEIILICESCNKHSEDDFTNLGSCVKKQEESRWNIWIKKPQKLTFERDQNSNHHSINSCTLEMKHQLSRN